MDNKELYEKCWHKWGEETQLKMLAEECTELIQAILKYYRVVNGSRLSDIAEEITDVEICIEQIKQMMFGDNITGYPLNVIKQAKLKRLEDILNG